jgi:hypothetical protein
LRQIVGCRHCPRMHLFPREEELRFLIGLEVGQVCLDPWSIQFRFSEGVRMTVQEQFEHVDARGTRHVHQASDERDTGPVFLRELVQQRVTKLTVEPLLLTLHFSNGAAILVRTMEGPYECGQIYPPGQPAKPIVF